MKSDREDDGFNFDDDLDGLEDSEEELEDVTGRMNDKKKRTPKTCIKNTVVQI